MYVKLQSTEVFFVMLPAKNYQSRQMSHGV